MKKLEVVVIALLVGILVLALNSRCSAQSAEQEEARNVCIAEEALLEHDRGFAEGQLGFYQCTRGYMASTYMPWQSPNAVFLFSLAEAQYDTMFLPGGEYLTAIGHWAVAIEEHAIADNHWEVSEYEEAKARYYLAAVSYRSAALSFRLVALRAIGCEGLLWDAEEAELEFLGQ